MAAFVLDGVQVAHMAASSPPRLYHHTKPASMPRTLDDDRRLPFSAAQLNEQTRAHHKQQDTAHRLFITSKKDEPCSFREEAASQHKGKEAKSPRKSKNPLGFDPDPVLRDQRLDYGHVQSRCGYAPGPYTPGGGQRKVFSEPLHQWKPASPASPTSAGQRLTYAQVASRCGSTANIRHVPGGGDKRIFQAPMPRRE